MCAVILLLSLKKKKDKKKRRKKWCKDWPSNSKQLGSHAMIPPEVQTESMCDFTNYLRMLQVFCHCICISPFSLAIGMGVADKIQLGKGLQSLTTDSCRTEGRHDVLV